MMMLLFYFILSISGFAVSGEQLIRCNSSPMNLCGSDLVIYKSECDFLNSKEKFSDLTILDLSDCINSGFDPDNKNTDHLNKTGNDSDLDIRSLRGAGIKKRDLDVDSTLKLSLINETQNDPSEILEKKDKRINYNDTLVFDSNLDLINLNDLLQNKTLNSNTSKIYNEFYMDKRASIFSGIDKYNVNLINVIVENFDISKFILFNGKYNISRLSMLVLETIIKILRNRKSKMQKYLNQLNELKVEMNNSTDTSSDFAALMETNDLYLNGTMNTSEVGQRQYNGLNVTLKLINLNNTNNYLRSYSVFDYALQNLSRMNNSILNNGLNISTKNNSMALSMNGENNETISRFLLASKEDSTLNIEGFNSNTTNNHLNIVDNCELNIPSQQDVQTTSSFHCIFQKNNTDNLKVVSKYILSLTEYTLGNALGYNSTLNIDSNHIPIFNYNPLLNMTSLLETNTRVLSSSQLENGSKEDIVLDFFDLLQSPTNNTNDDLKDFGIGEIFVNFDLNLLEDKQNNSISNVNNTTISEEMNELLKLESLIQNFSFNEQKSRSPDSTKLSDSVTNDSVKNVKTGLTIEDLFRDFPPAFDRVRGPNCVVKCDDQVDLHCASNGLTYKNLCEFRNAQCNNKQLIFLSFGKCLPLLIKS